PPVLGSTPPVLGSTPPVLGSTPLVRGDLVVVTAGAEAGLQALDRLTGEPRWQADTPGGDGAPVLGVTAAGLPLIVASGAAGASGHDPGSGLTLWQASWPASGIVAPKAVPLGRGRLLLGGGPAGVRAYDVQWQIGTAGLIAALLWRTTQLRPALSVGVEADGFVYGLDDGRLVCIDAATGYRRWQGARYGHGRILRAGSELLVQAEDGTVAIVVPSAEGSHERLRFRALHTRRGWAEPLLHDRWLLVRDDDEAALWELPAAVE
ncbi:MAG: PQQ-binding-like beta-propeller repeat protein, partial [bacterium]|nr:PQQ-binding-like beta-propeller repeat protein [bacterium]